jgi:hypothetical protein
VTLDHAKIIDLHKKGSGATAISKAMGCSRGAVYKGSTLMGRDHELGKEWPWIDFRFSPQSGCSA